LLPPTDIPSASSLNLSASNTLIKLSSFSPFSHTKLVLVNVAGVLLSIVVLPEGALGS